MKTFTQLLLIFALTTFSDIVLAEWTEIQAFDDGLRVFADQASRHREGDTAELLHMVRWVEPQSDDGSLPYQSTVVRHAYDCVGKSERYLSSVSYAGHSGDGGEVVRDDQAMEGWMSISEQSMEDKLWHIACGK